MTREPRTLEGQPVSVEGGFFTIGFSSKHQFHRSGCEKPQTQQVISAAIAAVLRKNLKIRTIILDQAEMQNIAVEYEPDPSAPAGDSPLVRDVLSIFGGEIVEDDNSSWEDS
jgi:hypothetical protein